MSETVQPKSARLESLDVLRGLDIVFLIGLQPFLMMVFKVFDVPGEEFLRDQLSHRSWEGFTLWDLVMPLFIFMSGITLPFSLAKHKGEGWPRYELWLRLLRRVVILWVLGGLCQGNFLALDINRIYLFSNTLQAIAAGTLIAYPAVLLLSTRKQIALTAGLLIAYWLVFLIFGDNAYLRGHNIAETIDMNVLGRFRDGAVTLPDGTVKFAPWYNYAWILPTLSFGAQMLLGAQAGNILRSAKEPNARRNLLMICGIALVAAGWGLHFAGLPVIKTIYTPSMVLVSCGYAFMLMGFFYWLVDIRGVRKPFGWLRIVGCNALLGYVLFSVVRFGSVVDSLFGGLQRHMGDSYALIPPLIIFGIIWLILWLCTRQKIFLRA